MACRATTASNALVRAIATGLRLTDFCVLVGFIDKEDINLPSLTVKETFQFSANVRRVSQFSSSASFSQLRLPSYLPPVLKELRVDAAIKMLGSLWRSIMAIHSSVICNQD